MLNVYHFARKFAFNFSITVAVISILALLVHPPAIPEIVNEHDIRSLLAEHSRNLNKHSIEDLSFELQNGFGRSPDTTAIILNWSRLPNVIQIVSMMCKHLLHDTVSSITVWNNNPRALSNEDFVAADCPDKRVRIYNSPRNLYFQARFIACAEASTLYCFIQDDDYLIWPEIIRTLRARIESTISGIHLLPTHEMLSSRLRMIHSRNLIHTTFAWLGYGALIKRSQAVEFLELLNHLNLTEEELNMADNYFTILSNMFPEVWFDQGLELGGGQPFTVGAEGEARNNKHIIRAGALLDSIMDKDRASSDGLSPLPYVSTADEHFHPFISRAPCAGSTCLLETSIDLLPHSTYTSTAAAENILDVAAERLKGLSKDERTHFLKYPPSHAVDRRQDTSFRSPENGREGDWISMQVFGTVPPDSLHADVVFLIGDSTEALLRKSVFEISSDGISWIDSRGQINCIDARLSSCSVTLRECHIKVIVADSTALGANLIFRTRLQQAIEARWVIYEMRVQKA